MAALETALSTLSLSPPDVFNHNIETVPRLYKAMRPGSDLSAFVKFIKTF